MSIPKPISMPIPKPIGVVASDPRYSTPNYDKFRKLTAIRAHIPFELYRRANMEEMWLGQVLKFKKKQERLTQEITRRQNELQAVEDTLRRLLNSVEPTATADMPSVAGPSGTVGMGEKTLDKPSVQEKPRSIMDVSSGSSGTVVTGIDILDKMIEAGFHKPTIQEKPISATVVSPSAGPSGTVAIPSKYLKPTVQEKPISHTTTNVSSGAGPSGAVMVASKYLKPTVQEKPISTTDVSSGADSSGTFVIGSKSLKPTAHENPNLPEENPYDPNDPPAPKQIPELRKYTNKKYIKAEKYPSPLSPDSLDGSDKEESDDLSSLSESDCLSSTFSQPELASPEDFINVWSDEEGGREVDHQANAVEKPIGVEPGVVKPLDSVSTPSQSYFEDSSDTGKFLPVDGKKQTECVKKAIDVKPASFELMSAMIQNYNAGSSNMGIQTATDLYVEGWKRVNVDLQYPAGEEAIGVVPASSGSTVSQSYISSDTGKDLSANDKKRENLIGESREAKKGAQGESDDDYVLKKVPLSLNSAVSTFSSAGESDNGSPVLKRKISTRHDGEKSDRVQNSASYDDDSIIMDMCLEEIDKSDRSSSQKVQRQNSDTAESPKKRELPEGAFSPYTEGGTSVPSSNPNILALQKKTTAGNEAEVGAKEIGVKRQEYDTVVSPKKLKDPVSPYTKACISVPSSNPDFFIHQEESTTVNAVKVCSKEVGGVKRRAPDIMESPKKRKLSDETVSPDVTHSKDAIPVSFSNSDFLAWVKSKLSFTPENIQQLEDEVIKTMARKHVSSSNPDFLNGNEVESSSEAENYLKDSKGDPKKLVEDTNVDGKSMDKEDDSKSTLKYLNDTKRRMEDNKRYLKRLIKLVDENLEGKKYYKKKGTEDLTGTEYATEAGKDSNHEEKDATGVKNTGDSNDDEDAKNATDPNDDEKAATDSKNLIDSNEIDLESASSVKKRTADSFSGKENRKSDSKSKPETDRLATSPLSELNQALDLPSVGKRSLSISPSTRDDQKTKVRKTCHRKSKTP